MGPWQEHSVTNSVRQNALNESASPHVEMLHTKYCVMHSVEVIYQEVFKRIHLQPLYNSTVCGTVLCTTSTQYLQCIKEKATTELGNAV